MNIDPTHSFDVTPKEAIALQRELVQHLDLTGSVKDPQLIAGVDAAFDGDDVIAAAVVWERSTDRVIEEHSVRTKVGFPYVPGLLSFREGMAIMDVLRRVENPVQAVLFDGAGVAHPRGLGIAAHLGLFLNVPTVGVAKSFLCGTYEEPGPTRGAQSPLHDKEGHQMGSVFRSRDHVRPLFLSPGNHISQQATVTLVDACLTKYRLPEPTRQADHLSKRAK